MSSRHVIKRLLVVACPSLWQGGIKTSITARLTARRPAMPDRPGRRLQGSRYGNKQEGIIMRIRFNRAGYAVAAGGAVTAMLGMGAASAAGASTRPDATTACNAACSDAFFQVPGPTDILAAHSGLNISNDVVRLVQGSNAAPEEGIPPIAQ